MKKRFVLIGIFLLMFGSRAWTTPPSQIELSYNKETEVLTIKVYHPSKSTRAHYIRRIFVYKNDEEIIKEGFPAQEAWGMTNEVKVPTRSGDQLRVKAVCVNAGSAEETILIPY